MNKLSRVPSLINQAREVSPPSGALTGIYGDEGREISSNFNHPTINVVIIEYVQSSQAQK